MKPVEIEFLMRGNLKKGMQDAQSTAMGLDSTLKGVRNTVAGLFAADKIADFGRQVVNVRKEMQSLKTSFDTLLGSTEKSDKMFGELKQLAATTPLMLKDLASGAQTMLGFNIEAEKIIPTLKAIGDISMGDAERFKSLTLAYSQMSATGKLMGQDLLQMINAGFNPLTEISRKTGKSIALLKDEMSKGAISADMVTDAFMAATSEGGKFNGMLEKQGKTLAGSLNQLQGAIDDMFNSIGEQSEGIINGTVAGIQTLVDNYEKVGKVLAALIVTYGAYKVAVMAAVAAEKVEQRALVEQALAKMNGIALTKAQAAAYVLQKDATLKLNKAQQLLNKTMLSNPYVLMTTALVAAVAAVWALSDGLDHATAAQNRLMNAHNAFKESLSEEEQETERLLRIIQSKSATDAQRTAAYKALKKSSYSLTQQYSLEQLKTLDLAEAMNKVSESNQDRSAADALIRLRKEREAYEYLIRLKNDFEFNAKAKKEGSKERSNTAGMMSNNVREVLGGHVGEKEIEKTMATVQKAIAKLEQEAARVISRPKVDDKAAILYSEEAKRLMNDWKTAKKTYEALLKDKKATDEQVKAARSSVDAADTAYEKLTGTKASAEDKQAKERAKKMADIKTQIIKMEQEAAFAARQAEIDGLEAGNEKVLKQLRLDYDKRLAEINTEKAESIAKAKEVTDAEQRAKMEAAAEARAKAQEDAAADEYQRGVDANQEAEAKAMRDYLTAWGAMQEKRAAITEEYNERIRKANTEGEKLSLKKEMERALSEIDRSALNLDWGMLFGDLSKYVAKDLKKLKAQVETYRKSEEYAKATAENKQAVDEAYAELEQTILDKSGIFGGIAEAFKQLSEAETELAKAEQDVKNATTAKEREEAQERVNAATGKKKNAQANVRTATDNARDSIASLAQTITQLGTASEMTLTDLGNVASQIAGAFGEAGQKAGGWIAAIFTLCDMVARDGIKGLFENVGKLVGQALGGLFGIDIDENTHYYEEQKKLNDNYLKLIEDCISKQEELLKKQSGMDAVKTYEDAVANLERKQEINAKNVKNYLNAGASKGFLGIGSSASNGVKLSKAFNYSIEDIVAGKSVSEGGKRLDALKEIMGVDSFSKRMEELATASVEQIQLMKENEDIWVHLPDDVQKYYQEILDANDAAEKLAETLRESQTAISFDNLRSSFLRLVKDVQNGTKEMSASFEDMMVDAILNQLTAEGSELNTALQDWYKTFAEYMADGLDKTEADALRKIYNNIYADAQRKRNEAYDAAGIDQTESTTQSGKAGAFETMTQDQGTKLEGLFTSGQIHWASMDELLGKIADRWGGLLDRLGELVENTSYCRHLADIADDIKTMRRDGLKMR